MAYSQFKSLDEKIQCWLDYDGICGFGLQQDRGELRVIFSNF